MENQTTESKWKKILTWKTALVVFGIVVLVELAWAAWTLTRPLPQPVQAPAEVIPMASLELWADNTNLKVGETFKVDINLITGGRATVGTDVILLFNPQELVPTNTQTPVTAGSLYKDYPLNSYDPEGRISFSGISEAGAYFTGRGVLGFVEFRVLKAGQPTVKIDYKGGSTIDSNVIESGSGKDILLTTTEVRVNTQP